MERQGECINILLVMPPQADDEVILEGIRRDFSDVGLNIGRLELRSSNVKQYLELHPDTDAVIVTEHQENHSYTPQELDEISICQEGLCVIPIIDESKGSSYVKQLEACGIYTAVFEYEQDYETIAKLIRSGRSKREARVYYGIEVLAIGAAAGGYDAANAVRYLVGGGDDYTELETRLSLLSERLGSTRKMLEVLGNVPEKTFQLVSRMDSYRELCRLVSEEKERPAITEEKAPAPISEQPTRQEEKPKKRRHKEEAVEHRQTIDIGVVATNVGVGCSYCSILLAHSLEIMHHAHVAIVEFDNRDAHFENLCRATMGTLDVTGIRKFEINGVDYFYNMSYSRFVTQHKMLYDYVIYDFGCADNAAIEKYFMGLNHKLVVAGGTDWRLEELEEFIYEVSKMDMNNSLVYLFPLINSRDMGNLARLVPNNLTVPVCYEDNPYRPGRKTRRMFEQVLTGTWKKKYSQETSIQEKSLRKPGIQWPVWCVLLSLILGITGGSVGTGITCKRAYTSSLTSALEQIEELKENLEASHQDAIRLEQELGRITVKSYSLKSPVPAGTIITSDMVVPITFRSSLTASAYIQAEDLGQVMARVNLVSAIPIYRSDVEKKRPLSIPEEMTGNVMEDGDNGTDG